MFDNLAWLPDRLRIGDALLALESFGADHRAHTDLLVIYKDKQTVEQYQRFFSAFPEFQPSSILELGLWDGGSLVFWNELLHPLKIVGVDLADRTDKPSFRSYVQSRGLENRVVTFWQTDQADKKRLRELVTSEFQGRLDLVIDDCSHIYAPTKASFEALFPLLTPGGWYFVEDWDWAHQPPSVIRKIPWAHGRSLTDLVVEIVKLVGSRPNVFARVLIQPGFVAVQRGPQPLGGAEGLVLETHIRDKGTTHLSAGTANDATARPGQDSEERVIALESQLQRAAALIDEYRSSRAWRLIEALRRLRVKLAPPGSSRERLWFAALDIFRR
jgi:cephalosporin hydroxylase